MASLPASGRLSRIHVDRHVGAGRGVVPERKGAGAMKLLADPLDVGLDPGHVRGSREAADLERPVSELGEPLLEHFPVDAAIEGFIDHHDVGDRFAPRQLVGVVLVGADEDHRPLRRRNPLRKAPCAVEIGGDAQIEDLDQAVNGPRRARPRKEHDILRRRAHGVADDPPRVLPESRRLPTCAGRHGVGVAVERQHFTADEVLDERQRSPRCRVVRVGHAARAERAVEGAILADH